MTRATGTRRGYEEHGAGPAPLASGSVTDEAWYYNVEERRAEQGPSQRGFAETRLGPYPSKEDAEGALAALHRRNSELDEEDRRWREG